MYDNIKSPDALKQGLDFSGLFPVVKYCTDIDNVDFLANDKIALVESKKETPNTCVDNIINSKQWKIYRGLGNKNVYLIYATHNLPIDKDKPIPLHQNTVKWVELNGEPIPFKKGISVDECVNYLGGLGMYYIRTEFKNGTMHFMKHSETKTGWSSNKFDSKTMAFKSLKHVENYLYWRKKSVWNKGRTFTVWYLNEDGELSEIKEAAVTC